MTGCLAKGADASSFTLSDAMPATADKEQSKEAPKSAEMKSYQVVVKDTSLKLADHVGHKVTLTGTVDESAAGAPKAGAPGATGTSRERRLDAEPLGDGTEDGRSELHAVGTPNGRICKLFDSPAAAQSAAAFLYGS